MSFDNVNVNVFKNNFKQTEKHPDFSSTFEVEGQQYRISMWEKKDKNGNAYFSTNISKDNYKKGGKTATEQPTNNDDPFNPF